MRISSRRRLTCRRCAPRLATASTCGCWCRVQAIFPRCRRSPARNIARCSKPACACSNGPGTMLHAKTAVADRRWSRVGSTNLNLASWMSNYELDVAIEDATFSEQMAWQYEADLARSTEIVLTKRNRVRRAPEAEAADRAARACGAARRVGKRRSRGGGCIQRRQRAGCSTHRSPNPRTGRGGPAVPDGRRVDSSSACWRRCGRVRSRGPSRSLRCGRGSRGRRRVFRCAGAGAALRRSRSSKTWCLASSNLRLPRIRRRMTMRPRVPGASSATAWHERAGPPECEAQR